jgi:hypothetical protein
MKSCADADRWTERVDMAKLIGPVLQLPFAIGSHNTTSIISAQVSATPPGYAIHHGIHTPSVHQYYLRIILYFCG